MSTVTNDEELGQAMTAAELTLEERELVVQTLEDSDLTAEEAIGAVLATRNAEPEEQPAPVAEPLATEPSDKQLRELDRENTRHIAKVHTIMGHFSAELEECDKCGTMGLVEPGPAPKAHPFYVPCETCNAFGQVLSGSLVGEHAAVPCPDCAGRGYLEAMLDNTPAVEIITRLRDQARAAGPITLAEAPPAAEPAENGGVTFGRPAWMGDPAISG